MARKIIWAVDPFTKEQPLQRSAAWALKNLLAGSIAKIEPVYCYSTYFTGEYPMRVPIEWIHEVKSEGQKKLNKLIRNITLPGIEPLHVLCEPYFSTRQAVVRMSRIAKRWGAELIVTSTHARKGIKRWFLGSFAETLLLHADVPVLFVNPNWNRQPKFKQIIFPTDFSSTSVETFDRVMELAQSLGSDITILHKLVYVWPPIRPMGHNAPLYSQAYEAELEQKQKQAAELANEALQRNIRTSISIDTKLDDSVARAIMRKAKEKHGLIAMASRSGSVKTSLLGSTTRKVVRESLYPVWVLHPQPERIIEPLQRTA